mmetsp:Transcript_140968/g.358269  ORF Transcript_140968/g.358269 Transcript_140968/m.358269 type:complete len:80 (-) Transcript_140968:19-258(-)
MPRSFRNIENRRTKGLHPSLSEFGTACSLISPFQIVYIFVGSAIRQHRGLVACAAAFAFRFPCIAMPSPGVACMLPCIV